MLVTQVQQSSRLYTTEYRIHKIITHNDEMKLSGSIMKKDFSVNLPLGERRIAILWMPRWRHILTCQPSWKEHTKGWEETHCHPTRSEDCVHFNEDWPQGVKEYVALTRRNFTDAELTNYEAQGRKQILNAIPQMGIIQQAQERCCTTARSDLHNDGL